jgi:twitching motility protein PilT
MADIDELFRMLVAEGGSDLHLSSGRKPLIRESGDMKALDLPVVEDADIRHFISEIIPERNAKEFEDTNDSDFAYEIPGFVRLRANVFCDRNGAGAVFRVIPTEILTVEDLNLPMPLREICFLSKGLVVVTGPTGSGKSTTLAAMIDLINRERSEHIITIEDPIEFVHKDQRCLVNQREIHRHTKSYASALRAALRQDPDIVLVGEMRDLETIQIAIETAETGHLVFGTLHTNTAISTVDRMIDVFPADRQSQIRTMLASSLKGVFAQTLCKKIGGGRVAAIEALIVDSGVAALIRDRKMHQVPTAMQVAKSRGNILMNEAMINLIVDEKITPAQAYLKAVDKADLLPRFDKLEIEFDPKSVLG